MAIPPNTVAQTDTLVAPLIAALTTVAQQISGLGAIYPTVPDAPPEDKSVVFAPRSVTVDDDETNAKLVLHVELDLLHLFVRARLQDNLASVLAALPAWLTVLTAWSNQELGGLAESVDLRRLAIAPYVHAQQNYLSLVATLDIRVVWNINME
jgi:hypothetical protein